MIGCPERDIFKLTLLKVILAVAADAGSIAVATSECVELL